MATQKIPGRAIKIGTDTAGDVTYFDGDAWRRLPIGEAGEVLTMNTAGTFPEWGAAQCPWNQGVLRGYSSGGNSGLHTTTSRYSRIDNYSFVTDGDATDWGDLVRDSYMMSGTASATHGYVMRGEHVPAPTPIDTIQKFSFAAAADATDVGNATVAGFQGTGHSSGVNGYCCYIQGWPITSNIVDRFPFATDTNATDVGNLNMNQVTWGGISSETHGYISGGHGPSNQIQKFSFATLGNATDVGDLLHTGHTPACSSSTTHNYNAGGWMGEQNPSNQINKWTTAQDNNATDVGDLWAVNYGCIGTQV